MIQLNLPSFPYKLKTEKEKIFIHDSIRKKFVRLTPEEWVRQHFVHYLLAHLGYPAGLTMNEATIQVATLKKRCDTVIYSKTLVPMVLVEYKSPQVALSQKTIDQIMRYNITLRVPYLYVSNGLDHVACHIDYSNNSYSFLEHIPSYNEIVESI